MVVAVYTADDGNDYKIRMDASNATAAGNPTYDGDPVLPDLPRSVKPRYRLLRSPNSGRSRKIICGNTADSLWTGGVGTTESIFDFATNANANFVLQGRVGEKIRAV